MNWEPIIKALLGIGVSLLTSLIPALAGGIPGMILGWLVPWLTGLLYDWVSRLAAYNKIEADTQIRLNNAKSKQAALAAIQSNPNATKEEHEKAIAEFAAAVSALGRRRM